VRVLFNMYALEVRCYAWALIYFGFDSWVGTASTLYSFLVHFFAHSLRILPTDDINLRHSYTEICDFRKPPAAVDDELLFAKRSPGAVSGLMREMILVVEFGKRHGIPGYRRSNRYHGQTVIDNESIKATISEIFVGPAHWGYVLDVENKLDSSQRLNLSTFRLAGTRAISPRNSVLAARPKSVEEQVTSAHKSKVYIIAEGPRQKYRQATTKTAKSI